MEKMVWAVYFSMVQSNVLIFRVLRESLFIVDRKRNLN